MEVHLLDVDADLYGTELAVRVLRRIREDMRFADAAGLGAQISKDIESARALATASEASTDTGSEPCSVKE